MTQAPQNASEVVRNNMPAGAITSGTLALTAVGGADETTWLTAGVNPALLVGGTNLNVAEIRQSGINSIDIRFDLELLGYTAASLVRLGVAAQPPALAVNWPG